MIDKIRKGIKGNGYFDYSLFFIIIFMLCFGLVMLYSTSSYTAQIKYGNGARFLIRQLVFDVAGVGVMLFTCLLSPSFIKKFSNYIYLFTVLSIFLVYPLGVELNGARRWVGIGPMTFQPAELVKIGVIIIIAFLAEKMTRKIRTFKGSIGLMFCGWIPAGLVYICTENLSSALIIAGITFIMVFVASPNYKGYLAFIAFVAVVVIGVIAYCKTLDVNDAGTFRVQRVVTWLNGDTTITDENFQVVQGLYAIGSGGLFGKGLGKSVQKLGFVPEAENDMIYTIICEELGIIGGISVILLFLFMIWRFMIISTNASDLFSSMVVVGVMAHISIQVILNIAVVTASIPNTGVTLPFISYGGTSVLILLAEMGMVLGVSRRIKIE
ncbi:MAG: cell division protein [Lachnospiraceae bacterium]|nr:cell division protein [Lachnospiraceae bacterium]MBQ4068477.1 FtsW/RodA/SpoVE family cell cycle protein [Lachnospiraceae bacterium]